MVARSSVADAIYRVLLRLYPARFQEEFALDMALDFADASDDAWERSRWRGLAAVWTRAAADLAGSLTVQWVRTGIPLIALLAVSAAVVAASTALTLAPQEPITVTLPQRDQDLALLMILVASVFLIIAVTIILSVCFLRPLIHRRQAAVRIRPTTSLRI